jgi:hypothetical protein
MLSIKGFFLYKKNRLYMCLNNYEKLTLTDLPLGAELIHLQN